MAYDLTGKKFNRLTVMRLTDERRNSQRVWECLCTCGRRCYVRSHTLVSGEAKSCGCIFKERNFKHGYSNIFNGRLQRIHNGILTRCYNPNHHSYQNYGARGIAVCDEWKSLENFANWALANGYEDNLSLDRINSSGNYEPSNCRWATRREQANNTRKNRFIEVDGVVMTIANAARKFGIKPATLLYRINKGIEPPLLFQQGRI